MIEIKGLQKTSLIDYPGKISAVVFLGGCNFRCPYCFNRELVLNPDRLKTIPQEEFFIFLKKKKEWLDAVVLSGGEPSMHKDLPGFAAKIKQLGFLVALETNGSNPQMIKHLIDKKLVDYLAMDIKAPLAIYERLTGVHTPINRIKESIEIIACSNVAHEFRTTVVEPLLPPKDVGSIRKLVPPGSTHRLQTFRPEYALDPTLRRYTNMHLGD